MEEGLDEATVNRLSIKVKGLHFFCFSLVSEISQNLLELEPHNLKNRLVVMRR